MRSSGGREQLANTLTFTRQLYCHLTVAERLRELRAAYPFAERERSWVRHEIDPDTGVPGLGEFAIDTGRLPEVVRPYWGRLGVLELHLVAYPYSVEDAIAPNAIVLSPSHDPRSQQEFEERFGRVVDQLVMLNESDPF